jgi:protein-disulfide isomerase
MSRLLPALAVAALLSPLAACGAKSGDAADSSASAAAPAAPASGAAAAPTTPPTPDPRVTAADGARIKGDPNAKVWIVVVSDFQCPYCAQWERETAPQVIKEFVETGVARLAFVNFPLQQHPNALPAAEAAMCAGAQGKFWEMHDRIFATQQEWSMLPSAEAFFAEAAGALGVAVPEYQACISDHVMRPMIEADTERATTGGAGSTPTFFIGNQVISGAEKIDVFRTAVKDAQSATAR